MFKPVEYKPEVLQDIAEYAKTCENPDEPFMVLGELKICMTDVVREVQNKTDLGACLYRAWDSLYIEKSVAGRE